MNKVALLLTTFNRPKYLSECLDSLRCTDLSKVQTILIVDDASTDKETLQLIDDFYIEGVEIIRHLKTQNKSIKDSLLFGFDFLFQHGINTVVNLDSDAIVSNDFIDRLLHLKNKYPASIVSGFNCNTLNKNGTVRHKHLYKEEDAVFRESVGGINMCIQREQYLKYVKPALQHTLQLGGNWDNATCINSMKDSLPVAVTVPSCCQHIGCNSSMNHGAGGEPMDISEDFKLLNLSNVTLIGVDGVNIERLIKAADISCKDINFGAVKLLTHLPSNDSRVIPIRKIDSRKEYSFFLMNEIIDYIDTDFFITIQFDGYILRAESWDKNWFNYDYIGSPWQFYTDGLDVGNGAMSLRSKRLHTILKEDKDIFPTNDHLIKDFQEDHCICRIYRPRLEGKYGIKYAPKEVAEKFGIEAWGVKYPDNKYNNQFGFHGKSVLFENSNLEHKPY